MLTYNVTHLKQLESEAIFVFRETAAQFERPSLLFSGGKDSIVMAHLAAKAFSPARVPMPFVHVDTGHNFPETIEYRDRFVEKLGVELVVGLVQESIDRGTVREETGPHASRNALQSVTLLETIEKGQFDACLGGGRRDEEKARAKERFFSHRDAFGQWDPKNQRPELWNLYNGRVDRGESIRVFPISNWTELDVWQYIHLEGIEIVPLYRSADRPVVERDGTLIMVDDDRFRFADAEQPQMRSVRFRTLGCYPLSGAVESTATTLPEIIQEMLLATRSEREGRVIDHDQSGSMEEKKREGYF